MVPQPSLTICPRICVRPVLFTHLLACLYGPWLQEGTAHFVSVHCTYSSHALQWALAAWYRVPCQSKSGRRKYKLFWLSVQILLLYSLLYTMDILTDFPFEGYSTWGIFLLRDIPPMGYSFFFWGKIHLWDIRPVGYSNWGIFLLRFIPSKGYSTYGIFFPWDNPPFDIPSKVYSSWEIFHLNIFLLREITHEGYSTWGIFHLGDTVFNLRGIPP